MTLKAPTHTFHHMIAIQQLLNDGTLSHPCVATQQDLADLPHPPRPPQSGGGGGGFWQLPHCSLRTQKSGTKPFLKVEMNGNRHRQIQ